MFIIPYCYIIILKGGQPLYKGKDGWSQCVLCLEIDSTIITTRPYKDVTLLLEVPPANVISGMLVGGGGQGIGVVYEELLTIASTKL